MMQIQASPQTFLVKLDDESKSMIVRAIAAHRINPGTSKTNLKEANKALGEIESGKAHIYLHKGQMKFISYGFGLLAEHMEKEEEKEMMLKYQKSFDGARKQHEVK